MFTRTITVHVEFPALDRLIDYLKSVEQRDIDGASDQVKALAERLMKSRLLLEGAIAKEKR